MIWYLVMSQRLPDEEVDSYVPPEGAMLEGGRPAGGDAGEILGSDAERASAVGQATAGPAGPTQGDLIQQLVTALRQVAGAV
ncbi:hypothetical protein JCGZ_05312 [Jatropha curcas]|uniref:Uncharacterized protein n=1 Tax=Jatropha curcas TaxID=180498 RepID=A0A067L293_JATCU|nr:hypothetical protein JCGZ_05312 [Jatropha curcas]